MRFALLVLCSCLALPAADLLITEGYPPLPNPFDFDRRLVLVDWFRERGEKLPADISEDDLVLRYQAAIDAKRPKAKVEAVADAERERLNTRRNMLLQLELQFKVTMAEDATDADIQARLDREVKAQRGSAPAPAPAAPRAS